MTTQMTTVPLDRYTRAALAEVVTVELLRLRGDGPSEKALVRAPDALCEGLADLASVEDAAALLGRLADVVRVLRDPAAQSVEVPLSPTELARRLQEDALYSLREAAGREETDPDSLPAITAAIQHVSALKDSLANDAGEVKVRAEAALGALDREANPHGGKRGEQDSATESCPAPDVSLETRAPKEPAADNGSTASAPLTAEDAGLLVGAIESHLLGLCLGDEMEAQLGLGAGRLDIDRLERHAARFAFYGRVLRSVDDQELPLDTEALSLLDVLESDAREQVQADSDGHPDDAAIAAGREARLRNLRAHAQHRVRLAREGDV